MSRHWKEAYTDDAAKRIGIRTTEGSIVLGESGAKWIYFVTVCGFTFAFYSLDMLRDYLEFYSKKTLPTTRLYGVSPYSYGAAASVGDGQSPFERLPLSLRKESKRSRVVKALRRALDDFESENE